MSVDKLVDSTQLNTDLTSVANAIRTKGGTSASLAFPSDFVQAIADIPSGGGGISADDIAKRTISGAITLSDTTEIKEDAFLNCAQITSVSGESVTTLNEYCFKGCSGLSSVSFPNLTTIKGQQTFRGCSSLTQLMFPNLGYNNNNSWHYIGADCTNLVVCDLGGVSEMKNNVFYNSDAMRTLILRRTGAICSLNWANASVFGGIYNHPLESTIYVPNALISAYQIATNWSTLYSMGVTFAKIEGSIYDLS